MCGLVHLVVDWSCKSRTCVRSCSLKNVLIDTESCVQRLFIFVVELRMDAVHKNELPGIQLQVGYCSVFLFSGKLHGMSIKELS